jgi:hypothetical protein
MSSELAVLRRLSKLPFIGRYFAPRYHAAVDRAVRLHVMVGAELRRQKVVDPFAGLASSMVSAKRKVEVRDGKFRS